MRRSSLVILVAVSLSVLASSRASALEGPLATLVPADVSTYSELDLDRMLWRAPETAPLAEAFAHMQSPRLLSDMVAELTDAEDLEALTQVLDVLSQASEAVGPRIGWATWIPDVQSLLGGMTEPSDLGAALSMIPKVLIVADVREADVFDELLDGLTQELGLPALTTEGVGGTRMTTFAGGMVALIRGDDWLAISFPPDPARIAADQWRSDAPSSLWSSPAYQAVIGRLPADATVTEYVSAKSVKQLVGLANVLAPEAQLPYPSEEPLGSAMGLRVEQVQGRRMATAYYTADVDALPHLVDAALALQLTFIRSELEKEREAEAAGKCAANLELLGTAMKAYLDEHGDRFPEAEGWAHDLEPYVDRLESFKCPKDDTPTLSSYAMNAALSGKSLAELDDPASILVLYEAASPGDSPSGGAADVVSPARHAEANHYLFADGHVELLEEAPSFEVE
jgi:prepilin-type processing-associated H-X9-DG protein